ncbi:MAG: hypothetical protein LT070_07065 [Solirubrobacteraceae bacterium]|nr:hypothetical protein [Solirubrobacteraceae bacterium]
MTNMTESARSRLPRSLILICLIASFSFGAIVATAFATHYHSTNGIDHGFVHGSSNTDGSFFSRVSSGTAPRSCQLDTVNHPEGYRTITIGDFTTTCNLWSRDIWESATECRYRADTYAGWSTLSAGFDWHVHRPVNYCG